MVMDFSWGWVKPGSVTTTEPRAKAMLELARLAIPQAMRHPIVGTRPELVERREGGSEPARRGAGVSGGRSGPPGPAFRFARSGPVLSMGGSTGMRARPCFFSPRGKHA